MAVTVTKKVAYGSGEECFEVVIGSDDATEHTGRLEIAKIIVFKDRYDALAAGERTAVDAYAVSSAISQAYTGG